MRQLRQPHVSGGVQMRAPLSFDEFLDGLGEVVDIGASPQVLAWHYRDALQRTSLSDRTIESYVRRIDIFIEWFERDDGAPSIWRVTDAVVADYLTDLRFAGYSSRTISTAFYTLRSWMGWIEEEGGLEEWASPMRGMALKHGKEN